MAADSDGTLTAVVICEGDFHDPDFPKKFKSLLGRLKSILEQPKRTKKFIKVNKVRDLRNLELIRHVEVTHNLFICSRWNHGIVFG